MPLIICQSGTHLGLGHIQYFNIPDDVFSAEDEAVVKACGSYNICDSKSPSAGYSEQQTRLGYWLSPPIAFFGLEQKAGRWNHYLCEFESGVCKLNTLPSKLYRVYVR
jgi:hypothetical protein